MSSPPHSLQVPSRGSSKRAPELSTEELQNEKHALSKNIFDRKKKLKGLQKSTKSFDAE